MLVPTPRPKLDSVLDVMHIMQKLIMEHEEKQIAGGKGKKLLDDFAWRSLSKVSQNNDKR